MNILLVQHAAIGDVLMCTPAIRALKKNRPDDRITFLVDKRSYDAVRHNPHIDCFIVSDIRMSFLKNLFFIFRFMQYRFDLVIDFQRNPRSALLTFLTFASKRISFSGKHRNFAYNIKVEEPDVRLYAGIRKLKLLSALNIREESDFYPEMHITNKDRAWADAVWKDYDFHKADFIVALSPVSKRKYKTWALENYAKLCDYLISQYRAKVLFTWGPGEWHFIEGILVLMKDRVEVRHEIKTLKQLYALFEKSNLFIGNDNGPRHIAMTAGIPTVGIFGGTYPGHWTPPNDPDHLIVKSEKRGIVNLTFESALSQMEPLIKAKVKRYREKKQYA